MQAKATSLQTPNWRELGVGIWTLRPTPTKAPTGASLAKSKSYKGQPWDLIIAPRKAPSRGHAVGKVPMQGDSGKLGNLQGADTLYRAAAHVVANNVDRYSFEQLADLPEAFCKDIIDIVKAVQGHTLGLWWLETRLLISRGEIVHRKRLETVNLADLLTRAARGDDTLPIRAIDTPAWSLVTSLHLHRCATLDDKSCLALRHLRSLTILYTTYCAISDVGILSLGCAVGPSHGLVGLKAWWLDGCGRVSDRAVKAINNFPALELLSLANTSATEAAIVILSQGDYRWELASAPSLPYSPDKAHAKHVVVVAEHAEQVVRLLTDLRPPHLGVVGLESGSFTQCTTGLLPSPHIASSIVQQQHLPESQRIADLLKWSRSAEVDDFWWQPQPFSTDPANWVYCAQGRPLTLRRRTRRTAKPSQPTPAAPNTASPDLETMLNTFQHGATHPRPPMTALTTSKRRRTMNPFAKPK